MPDVWGYARVSREDQQLALQLDALAAAGVPHGNIIKEKESGVRQRPAFGALVERLQPGDSLVAWKVDRLGRDALAALTIARDLDRRGVRIVITTLGVDSSTPAGRMVFDVLAQLAEFERATLIERTNAGLAAARARHPPGPTFPPHPTSADRSPADARRGGQNIRPARGLVPRVAVGGMARGQRRVGGGLNPRIDGDVP